jgi:hypothetical protein
MKKIISSILLLTLISFSWAQNATAAIYDSSKVMYLFEDSTRPCMFFQLEGVGSGAIDGGTWFALQRSHKAYSELFAMLLTAKAAKLPLRVSTTGNLDCGGFAAVEFVWLH